MNGRGELPETRSARLVARLCGLLPLVAPWSRRQAAGQPQSCGFGITRWRIGNQLRQSPALASSAGAVWLKTSWRRLRGDRQVRNTRTMRSGVAGPGPHSNFGQLVVSSRALGSRFGITPVSNPFPLLALSIWTSTSDYLLQISCGFRDLLDVRLLFAYTSNMGRHRSPSLCGTAEVAVPT